MTDELDSHGIPEAQGNEEIELLELSLEELKLLSEKYQYAISDLANPDQEILQRLNAVIAFKQLLVQKNPGTSTQELIAEADRIGLNHKIPKK